MLDKEERDHNKEVSTDLYQQEQAKLKNNNFLIFLDISKNSTTIRWKGLLTLMLAILIIYGLFKLSAIVGVVTIIVVTLLCLDLHQIKKTTIRYQDGLDERVQHGITRWHYRPKFELCVALAAVSLIEGILWFFDKLPLVINRPSSVLLGFAIIIVADMIMTESTFEPYSTDNNL